MNHNNNIDNNQSVQKLIEGQSISITLYIVISYNKSYFIIFYEILWHVAKIFICEVTSYQWSNKCSSVQQSAIFPIYWKYILHSPENY